MDTDAMSETSILFEPPGCRPENVLLRQDVPNGFQNSGSTFWFPTPQEVSEVLLNVSAISLADIFLALAGMQS